MRKRSGRLANLLRKEESRRKQTETSRDSPEVGASKSPTATKVSVNLASSSRAGFVPHMPLLRKALARHELAAHAQTTQAQAQAEEADEDALFARKLTQQSVSFSRNAETQPFRGREHAREHSPRSPQEIAAVLAQRAAASSPFGGGSPPPPTHLLPAFPSGVTVTKLSAPPTTTARLAKPHHPLPDLASPVRALLPLALPQSRLAPRLARLSLASP